MTARVVISARPGPSVGAVVVAAALVVLAGCSDARATPPEHGMPPAAIQPDPGPASATCLPAGEEEMSAADPRSDTDPDAGAGHDTARRDAEELPACPPPSTPDLQTMLWKSAHSPDRLSCAVTIRRLTARAMDLTVVVVNGFDDVIEILPPHQSPWIMSNDDRVFLLSFAAAAWLTAIGNPTSIRYVATDELEAGERRSYDVHIPVPLVTWGKLEPYPDSVNNAAHRLEPRTEYAFVFEVGGHRWVEQPGELSRRVVLLSRTVVRATTP